MNSHISSTRATLLLALVTTAAALCSAPAQAATKVSSNYQNAGGNCHAASPTDEFSMLRTPLGYRNRGTDWYDDDDSTHHDRSNAHATNTSNTNTSGGAVVVICNFATDVFAVAKPTALNTVIAIDLFARNTLVGPGSAAELKCVLWGGYETGVGFQVVAPTKLLPRGGLQNGAIKFRPVAPNYLPGPPNVVCTVPVGVELNDAVVVFEHDVGN